MMCVKCGSQQHLTNYASLKQTCHSVLGSKPSLMVCVEPLMLLLFMKARRFQASRATHSTTVERFHMQAKVMAMLGLLMMLYLRYRHEERITSRAHTIMVVEGPTCAQKKQVVMDKQHILCGNFGDVCKSLFYASMSITFGNF